MTPWDALHTVEYYQLHPVEWVRDALGVRLTEYQQEILVSLVDSRIVAVKSCHSAGKSLVAACAVLWFLFCHDESKVITTAPTKRQVEGILWSEITTLYRKAKRLLGGDCLTTTLSIDTNWYAWGFTSGEQAESKFQGFHALHILIIVDEAAGVAPKIYEQIETILSGSHPRMLMIGNPTVSEGDFFDSFSDSDVSKHTVGAFDTPNFVTYDVTIDDIRNDTWRTKVTGPYPFPGLIEPEMVRRMWKKWCRSVDGEADPRWQGRVMARFPVNSDHGLVPLAWIEAANERYLGLTETETSWTGPGRLGCDIARYGPDNTVAAEGYDQGVKTIHMLPKMDTTETTGWIGMLLLGNERLQEARIDADGLGAGVYDNLHADHPDKAIEMRGGFSASDPERFFNARSEWFWTVREDLNPSNPRAIALPVDDELTEQLTKLRWKNTRKGLIQVESKEEYRERGHASPDKADAVAYLRAEVSGAMLLTVDAEATYREDGGFDL